LNTKAWVAILSCLPLGACTGSLFKSTISAPVAYVLSAAPAAAAPAAATPAAGGPAAGTPADLIPADLRVLKPRMRPGLETERIVAKYPDRRLDFYAGAKWNGSVDDVLQDLTVQLFQQRARLRSVSVEGSRFTSGYWLEIEVEDFQAEYAAGSQPGAGAAPVIHVHMFAHLGRAADRAGLGSFEASASQAASADRMEAIVAAYELATNQALARIVDGVVDTLATATAVTTGAH